MRSRYLLRCSPALLLLASISCGPSEAEQEWEGAKAAREGAVESKAPEYAKTAFGEAEDLLSKAVEARDAGDDYEALRLFRQASNRFLEASQQAELNVRAFEEVRGQMGEAEKRRKLAEEAKAPVYARESYDEGVKLFGEAEALMDDPSAASEAHKLFGAAMSLFDDAVMVSQEKAKAREFADQLMALALKAKETAKGAEDVEGAKSYLREAVAKERDAMGQYNSGEFQDAAESFREMKDLYEMAAYEVKAAAEKAKEKQVEPPAKEEGSSGDDGANGDDGSNGNGDESGSGGSNGEGTSGKKTGPSKGELSEADEKTLKDGIGKLFSVDPHYDGTRVRLEYNTGTQLKNDCTILLPRSRSKRSEQVVFEKLRGVPKEGKGKDAKPKEYAFGGNTEGALLIDCQFVREVEVEFEFQLQLILRGAAFLLQVMSDGRTYYASDFFSTLYARGPGDVSKGYPARSAELLRPPSEWFPKTRAVPVKLSFSFPEGESRGTVKVSFDGEEVNEIQVKRDKPGKVGFQWRETKFVVHKLKLSGRLDKKWALAELKKSRR